MPQEQSSSSSMRVYTLLLTLIALVALLAMVVVRSRADSTQLINQQTDSVLTPMTIDSQGLYQLQGSSNVSLGYDASDTTNPSCPGVDCPVHTDQAVLTPGSLSVPVHYIAHITVPNGVENTLLKPHAELGIEIFNTGYLSKVDCTLTSCANNDLSYGAANADPLSVEIPLAPYVTLDPDHPGDPTKALIDFPMPMPYFSLPGEWQVAFSLAPVDANGAADYNYTLTNGEARANGAGPLYMYVSDLLAIDVSPSDLTYVQTTANGTGPVAPNSISDTERVVVRNKGNV